MSDTFVIVYIVVSLIVIIFQALYIRRLLRVIRFAVDSLRKYAHAILNDDRKEMERIDNDVKNFK